MKNLNLFLHLIILDLTSSYLHDFMIRILSLQSHNYIFTLDIDKCFCVLAIACHVVFLGLG